jgi:uncharacterized membrane protein
MPTDSATSTVVVDAPLAQVLATIRAVETQPEWVPEIREAEVLSRDADGLPETARFAASTPVGTDRYTLGYEHVDDGMRWHLVEGRLQTAQDAAYSLVALDDARTEVTFALTISHNLPLPGFVRSRVIKGLAGSTTSGLADRLR